MTRPDRWITRHLHRIPQGGHVLDVAAGKGRHTTLAASLGYAVTAVDRDISGLQDLSAEVIEADLEDGPWPLSDRKFDGILVCNYLWRPLFTDIVDALAPGGILIWSTFATGNEAYGRPRNPDFLLSRNELLEAVTPELDVIAFQHGRVSDPAAVRQSIVARKP